MDLKFRYRYTGDSPNVFVSLKKNGRVWVPTKGDTIDLDYQVRHPLLEAIQPEMPVTTNIAVPAKPEITEPSKATQESEDNN